MNPYRKCSIVIPLYNKELSIRRSIISVLNQTYSDFELIVVNDGSTDRSLEVAKRIQDNRLRIIDQENAGESMARNKGTLEASSDLVAFLDADDEWMPEFLSQVLHLSEIYNDCGLFGSFFQISDGSEPYNLFENDLVPIGWTGVIKNYFEMLHKYSYSPFCSSSVMVRKKLLMQIGGFPPGIKRGGDLGTWFILSKKTSFAYINSPLSVVHFDAENRACMMFEKPLEDYYPIVTLLKMARENLFSRNELQNVVEYLARHQIQVARHYLRQGERRKARNVLFTFTSTKIFKHTWFKYYVYSLLPGSYSKRLIEMRP
jgi:glycosyltransferase involved in cell wall biosynthesis